MAATNPGAAGNLLRVSERFVVDESARLLQFLRLRLPDWKRSTLEQRMRSGCVRVNDVAVRRNDVLVPGDEVHVTGVSEGEGRPPPPGLVVLHVDEELVAIDKPAGLLSVGTEHERERTALALLRASLSRPGKPASLWPVHRLDRETSGVLLFARTLAARDALQARWNEARKLYLAIVTGTPAPKSGTIEQPLFEDDNLFVRAGPRPGAKAASTRYTTCRTEGGRALLEVELDTGRKHQIRAHLAWLGHPLVGDARYGVAGPRLGLHALRLCVSHPALDRELALEASPPREFLALLRAPSR